MDERSRRNGFSLLEVLVVIAIIMALAGFLSSAGSGARRQAKEFKARTMIAALESALAMYHVDFGAYPPDSVQNMWVNLLADQAAYAAIPDWHGPYMPFNSSELTGTIPGAAVKDPWGNAYHYVLAVQPPYRIWSNGPDGMNDNGGGDDIRSW